MSQTLKKRDYARMRVELIKGFVGYENIMQIIDLVWSKRDRAFLACLFLTGGRVGEVLKLNVTNFVKNREKNTLEVTGMFLSKRYRREYLDKEKKKWKTVSLKGITRDPFPIRLDEPPTKILLEWIETCKKNNQELLFESPYGNEQKPLTRFWAYKFVRKVDQRMNHVLHYNLGLEQQLIDKVTGEVVKTKLNLWCHWFRSQRACCLASVFKFDVVSLVDFFKWKDIEMAVHYAKLGSGKLADKLNEVKAEALK